MDLGPGFSIEANRQRFLRAAGLSLCCAAGCAILCSALAGSSGWPEKMKILPGIALAAAGTVVFGLLAWVRCLDWTRGRRGLLGSAE